MLAESIALWQEALAFDGVPDNCGESLYTGQIKSDQSLEGYLVARRELPPYFKIPLLAPRMRFIL